MAGTWTMHDGKVLEIKWMDSTCLYNEFIGTAMRTLGGNSDLLDELDMRGYRNHLGGAEQPQHRETKAQMCWLRALIDSRAGQISDFIDFRDSPDAFIERIQQNPDVRAKRIIARAMKYRLAR